MARNSVNAIAYPDVCEARPVGRAQFAINRLNTVNDTLGRILDLAEGFGDRMLGALPSQGATIGKTDIKQAPNGTLDALHEEISSSEALASRLSDAIHRLSEID